MPAAGVLLRSLTAGARSVAEALATWTDAPDTPRSGTTDVIKRTGPADIPPAPGDGVPSRPDQMGRTSMSSTSSSALSPRTPTAPGARSGGQPTPSSTPQASRRPST